MNFLSLLLALIVCHLSIIAPALAASAAKISHEQAYQMLKKDSAPLVRSLPQGEREILMATVALENNRSSEAIELLSSPNVGKDPVAARLRAEAYRRQSIQAAIRAGKYAHAVSADIGKLEHAGIELESATLRLQAFIDQVSSAHAPQRVAVAKPSPVARTVTAPAAAVPAAASVSLLQSVRQSVERWRRDWASLNTDAYLAHYHAQFSAGGRDLAAWSAYKRRVNGNKTYIHINISNLRIVGGPIQVAQGEAVLVAFTQKYESSNYSANSLKKLYLVRARPGDPWLILSEGGRNLSLGRAIDRRLAAHKQPSPAAAWVINLASFDSKEAAERMVAGMQVSSGGRTPSVADTSVGGKVVHRVRMGIYDDKAAANAAMTSICATLQLSGCWLEQVN